MDAKFAKGDLIRVVKQYLDVLLPGEIYEVDSVRIYGDAEGFICQLTRFEAVGASVDRHHYGCLKDRVLAEHVALVRHGDTGQHNVTVQYLRDDLRDIQAKIQEYQAAERETLDQLAAVLCCFKIGEEVTCTKTGDHLVVTRVTLHPDDHLAAANDTVAPSDRTEGLEFMVELRYTDGLYPDQNYQTSRVTTNAGLQRALTKV